MRLAHTFSKRKVFKNSIKKKSLKRKVINGKLSGGGLEAKLLQAVEKFAFFKKKQYKFFTFEISNHVHFSKL